uniref:Malate dehydrogenase n=1 Tax=Solanum tuberosum TaxID=4113 RepID=M1CGF8_SOLTU
MAKQPTRVLVTGAAGQIGYALVPMIARGAMLGLDQPVIIHMLDIEPAAESLKGVKMELIDAAFPLLKDVVATTDVVEACKGVNVAVMVGGFPRKEGMERKDVMTKNVSIYKAQASALEQHAAPDCKVLVVANPANTNALILKEFAPSFPAKNITCLTRLDHNRALGQVSEKLNVHVGDVKNVTIWGNHSSTQYPDVNHATVKTAAGEKPVRELVANDQWLNTEFITTVQQRGAAIIKARKLSSALSAASSACDHIRDWVLGTPKVKYHPFLLLTLIKMGHLLTTILSVMPRLPFRILLTSIKCMSFLYWAKFLLHVLFRGHGFQWGSILMDLMAFQLV